MSNVKNDVFSNFIEGTVENLDKATEYAEKSYPELRGNPIFSKLRDTVDITKTALTVTGTVLTTCSVSGAIVGTSTTAGLVLTAVGSISLAPAVAIFGILYFCDAFDE